MTDKELHTSIKAIEKSVAGIEGDIKAIKVNHHRAPCKDLQKLSGRLWAVSFAVIVAVLTSLGNAFKWSLK